ncbi:metalloregulator ArsR/SmtB family transcription factor [Deinococcus deserti]|uniref:Putative transcriptional regulator, ArsR family n=1 Tax=Deinococcus deserti (strain DSM 17065 / CIP 109153 / LMG 22923 / VCD115) TaxID=546414 RepID=C1D2M6_DEIDV|nr:metalloregulator ArsR/SmtB family transcription factor [Deinococcus deserti]ACO47665.1 putative transcriptional regulator, ArsR family [Deinococcus deserti VCD115]
MEFDTTAEVFKALGDPHRLKALHFLATATPGCCQNGESVCACDLVDHLGLAQPTVSHHMRLLVNAGLVTAEKRGRWTHYTLSLQGLDTVQSLLNILARQIAQSPACTPASRPQAQAS